MELDDLATASCAKAASIVTSNNMVFVVFMFPPIEMYSNGAATLRNVKRGFDLRLLRVATASFRPALDALDRQPDPQGNRNISRVAAGCRLVEFGRDVPPRCLVAEVRGQVLPDQKANVGERRQRHDTGDDKGSGQRPRPIGGRPTDAGHACRRSRARSGISPAAHQCRRSDCKPRTACPGRTRTRPRVGSCRAKGDRDAPRRPSRCCRNSSTP